MPSDIRAPRPRAPVSSGARQRGGLEPRQRGMLLLASIVVVILLLIVLIGGGGGTPASQTLAQSYVNAWAHGNYAAMYADINATAQAGESAANFVAHHQAALATATATYIKVAHAHSPQGGNVTVPVKVYTRIFGTLHLNFVVPTGSSDNKMSVIWTRSLVFPGLLPGQSLTRDSILAPRASLEARDGTPLSQLSSAANIIGDLGPIPGAEAARLQSEGYPTNALVGLDGLQAEFQQQLAGKPGGLLYEGGRLIASAVAQPASPVRTTLSPALQTLSVATLGTQVGSIVALLPNGEVTAVAGTPFSDLQPPGSTFKIVTATAVLLAGIAKPSTVYPYSTSTTIDGYTMHNANGEDCGGTLANSFAVSCNSVFAPLGASLGASRLLHTAELFGFNQQPSLSEVAESTIPPTSLDSSLAVGSSAIGQGEVLASTLQMAQVAATIADGGRRPTPSLLLHVSVAPVRVFGAQIAREVRQLMLGVVEHGTGTAAQIPGVQVAGKTGTAELTTTVQTCTPTPTTSCPPAGADDPADTDAWFVAFAPARKPRIIVGVLLPQDGAGGSTAAPLARVILKRALALSANGSL